MRGRKHKLLLFILALLISAGGVFYLLTREVNALVGEVSDATAPFILTELQFQTNVGIEDTGLDEAERTRLKVEAARRLAEEKWKASFQSYIGVTYKNAIRLITDKLVQDTAKWVASGGKGKESMFYNQSWGEYLSDAADEAAGTFLADLASKAGFDICAPFDLRVNLSLGLAFDVTKPTTKCSFSELRENFSPENILENTQLAFEPKQSELSAALDVQNKLFQRQLDKLNEVTQIRQESGFKPVEAVISGDILAPGSYVETTAEDGTITSSLNRDPALYYTGEYAAETANVFLSTLTQELMKKWQGGWSLSDLVKKDKSQSVLQRVTAAIKPPSSRAIDADYASAVRRPALVTAPNYDLVQNFSVCNSDGKFNNIDNCVISQELATVVKANGTDGYLTVSEAIRQNYLKQDMKFGFSGTDSLLSQPSYDTDLPYSSLIKMRRARIIPIGWELAALEIRKNGFGNLCVEENIVTGECIQEKTGCAYPARPCTLGDMVDGFYNPDSRFYKLVNPEWVLKAPPVQCNIFGPGQLLQAGTAGRKDYCADVQDCIVMDDDGVTCKEWGYCLAERNIWRFNGDQCDAQYDSCLTYTRTEDNQQFSYLKKTVDFDGCNADNAGCKWYSTEQNAAGDWQDASKIFLNGQVAECDAENAGCSEFLWLQNYPVNMTLEQIMGEVKADTNGTTDYNDYGTVTSLYLNGNREQCLASEVGCELYTSESNGLAVPGILTPQNLCPQECVGYNSYSQEKTFFENASFPVDFIPSTARTCQASAVGCDEFTNLDTVAAGGEGLEYYQELRLCQKPAPENNDCAAYYTWEGSDISGYQLQAFSLQAGNVDRTGAPFTTDGTTDCSDPTSPNCREFYDVTGATYKRDMNRTVTCSNECRPLRKTQSTQVDCEGSGGEWNGSFCIYNAIPQEGKVCAAQENACRQYVGPTGANIQTVFSEEFEADFSDWSFGSLSSESIAFGGHSLLLSPSVSGTDETAVPITGAVQKDQSYLLKLWLRPAQTLTTGGIYRVDADFIDSAGLASSEIRFDHATINTTEWNQYILGPVKFTREVDVAGEQLVIHVYQANTDGTFTPISAFIDNVILQDTRENFFVIKNSWQTPSSCDAPTPKAKLGCQIYTDRQNRQIPLTSFSRLCREQAVGCLALIDTKNSSAAQSEICNARDGCFLFDESRAIDPDDTVVPEDSVVYLVNNEENYCQAEAKGCMALGQPNLLDEDKELEAAGCTTGDTACEEYQTVFKINNPDAYGRILCGQESLSCEAYTANGQPAYFKDPAQKTCDYRQIPGTLPPRYGWYKSTTARDSQTPDCAGVDINASTTGLSAIQVAFDTICVGGEFAGATGCDPRNHDLCGAGGRCVATPKLNPTDNWVGLCPQQQSQCTAFREPSVAVDVSFVCATGDDATVSTIINGQPVLIPKSCSADTDCVNDVTDATDGMCVPDNKICVAGNAATVGIGKKIQPKTCLVDSDCGTDVNAECVPEADYYFYLNNDKIDKKSCNGIVNWNLGCILFDDTSKDLLTFNTVESPGPGPADLSGGKPNGECGGEEQPTCDANTIIKVARDRMCAEALSCSTKTVNWDPNKQALVTQCLAQARSAITPDGQIIFKDPPAKGLCVASATGTPSGDVCEQNTDCATGELCDLRQVAELYSKRDVSWGGTEYAGYTVPNTFPVDELTQHVYRVCRASSDNKVNGKSCDANVDCRVGRCANATAKLCTQNTDCGGETTACVKGKIGYCSNNTQLCSTDEDCNPNQDDQNTCIQRDTNGVCAEETYLTYLQQVAGTCTKNDDCKDECGTYLGVPQIDVKDGQAICKQSACYCDVGIQGKSVNQADDLAAKTCRLYPENDAPFDASVSNKAGFTSANFGEPGNITDCSYTKAVYGGTTKYYDGANNPLGRTSPPAEISTGTGATTNEQAKTSEDLFIGIRGYCMETDPRIQINGSESQTACLTWYPNSLVGEPYDIYNHYPEAGFNPGQDIWYCVDNGLLVAKGTMPFGGGCGFTNGDRDGSETGKCTELGLTAARGYTAFCQAEVNYCTAHPNPPGIPLGDTQAEINKLFWKQDMQSSYLINPDSGMGVYAEVPYLNVCKTALKVYDKDDNAPKTNILWSANQEPTLLRGVKYDDGQLPFGGVPNEWVSNKGFVVTGDAAKIGDKLQEIGIGIDDSFTIRDQTVALSYGPIKSGSPSTQTKGLHIADLLELYAKSTEEFRDWACRVDTGWTDYSGYCSDDPHLIAQSVDVLDKAWQPDQTVTQDEWRQARAAGIGTWDRRNKNDFNGPLNTQEIDDRSVTMRGVVENPGASNARERYTQYTSRDTFTVKTGSGTVQSSESKNLDIKSGDQVTIRFYAYNANGNQMPLRYAVVDWGDGEPKTFVGNHTTGALKNHKPICKASGETGYNFGDTKEACQGNTENSAGYFEFSKIIKCPTGQTDCTINPRVMVIDNWEWCTNGQWGKDGLTAPCNPDNTSAVGWIEFTGKIIVQP